MMLTSIALLPIVSIATLLLLPQSVDAHGHLTSPRSRNWYAAEDGGSGPGVPPIDYCPHCLNVNNGVCGYTSYNDYDNFKDSQGNPMPWTSQGSFTAGQFIEIKSYLDTHHNGHMEIRACADGSASTLACFDTPGNELTFVRDVAFDMPADPAHPERGYYYGGQGGGIKSFHMEFKLPDHISGPQVLLQWKYITANSCQPPGYAAYFGGANSQGKTLPSSFWTGSVVECTPPYPSDGTRSTTWPEQFFNCAEITVDPAVPTVSPAPTEPPTTRSPDATPAPSKSPVEVPTWGAPTGAGCCSQDLKSCITWCGSTKDSCESCNQDVVWLPNGSPPDTNCRPRHQECTVDPTVCCPGLTCNALNEYYSQCQYVATPTRAPIPTNKPAASPTLAPVPTHTPIVPQTPAPVPTKAPTTSAPVPTMAPVTRPPTDSMLFHTDSTLSTWQVFQGIDALKYTVSESPNPIYAYTASGGAAGSGNVVTESQAYGLLITGIVLASWDTHKEPGLATNTDRETVLRYFEGYYNGWKLMCQNSVVGSACQGNGSNDLICKEYV